MFKRLAFAAFAATLALALRAAPAAAQKALVYCPAAIDGTGCNRIVDALGPRFAEGVDRGYDGSNGTVDLRKVDLQHYSVVVVPSLADNDASKPFALLREVAPRFKMAINGRVAVYAGAPDQGGTNRDAKNSLITNLATWASGGHKYTTGLVGLVAFLDLSTDAASRYDWVRAMSPADVSADAELQSFGSVDASGDAGSSLSFGGSAIKYGNMASLGLHIGRQGAVHTVAAATAGANKKAVLVKYSLTPDISSEGASFSKAKIGGASFSTSSSDASAATTSGPTLTTDKQDYMPGDTVTFSGTGFAPNDTVVITLHEDPAWIDPDRTVTAIADASGSFTNHTFVVDQHDFGVTFTATAVGSPSGLTAQTVFTDGNKITFSDTRLGAEKTAYGAVPAGACTAIWVQERNGANIDSTHAARTVSLSSSPSGASFYASSTCAAPVSSVTIAANSPATQFWFKTAVSTTLNGDGGFTGSNNASTSVTVAAANWTLTITGSGAGVGTITSSPAGINCTLTAGSPSNTCNASFSNGTVVTLTASASGTAPTAAGSTFGVWTGDGTGSVARSVTMDADKSVAAQFKANQTISFSAPVGKTFGDADFDLGATATSGLTVSYQSTTTAVCTIVAGQLHIVTAGQCSVTASQAGDVANYNAAPNVPQTFTIAKAAQAPLTVTAPTSGVFNDKLTPAASGGSGTGALTFTATGSACQMGAGADAGKLIITHGTGDCFLTATKAADDNYLVATSPQATVTVSKASQTIAFGMLPGKTYGDPDFSVSATASSELPVSFAAGANSKCTVSSTGTVHLTGAGSCTVIASQAGNGDYSAATDVPQTFAIAVAASVTVVTATDASYDGNPHGATANVTGFGGLNQSVSVMYSGRNATVYPSSATPPTNAGDYTATANFAGDADHAASSDSKNYSITKANQTISLTAPATKTYGDADFTVTATATSGLTVTLTASGNCTISSGSVHLTGAGSCTIKADQAGDGNYNPASQVSQAISIAKAVSATVVTIADATFDGSPHGGTANVTGFGGLNQSVAISYEGRNATTYGPSSTAPTNAGDYKATANFAGDADHEPSADTKNFSIAKATSSTSVTCPASVTYNGSAQTPCTVSVTGAGGLNESPSPTYANNMNAGTATASYAFSGDANHNGSSDSKTFEILRAQSSTVVTVSGATYDGNPHGGTAAVTGVGGLNQSLTVTYTGRNATVYPASTTAPTNAGDYTASASFAGDANHEGSNDSQNFSIAKAPSTTTLNCSAGSVYTGSAIEPCSATATGVGGLNAPVTPVSYSNNVNAGTANASATYNGDANHEGSTNSTTFEIAKANSTTQVNCPASVTYTGSPLTPCTAAATGAGGLNASLVPSYSNNVNAGTATANASFTGDDNHLPSANSATFTIEKASSTTLVTVANATFDGSPHGGSASATGAGGLNQSLTVNYTGRNSTTYSSSTAPTDAGDYTASASFAGDANHTGSSDSKDFSIAKAASVTALACPASVTYTGDALTPCTASATGAGGLNASVTVTYSNNVNAGTASASANYAGDANHNGSSDSKNFTIDKASSTTTVSCSAGPFVYNGSPQTPCSVSVTGAGSLNLSAAPNYTNNTNAGTATASYTFAGDANHTGSSDSKNFTIEKATIAAAVLSDLVKPYTGGALKPKVTTVPANVVVTLAFAQNGNTVGTSNGVIPVGVYNVTATITDPNYTGPSADALFVIFDATGGFVTGGGWIDSPAGAYVKDPLLTGKANFGFVSKYQKGANVPTGNTEFQFKEGSLNFKSTDFQWLVINGTAQAQFKGTGTINGSGKYNFMVTAVDGDAFNGAKKQDAFRIKITDAATGTVVYDNQMGSSETGFDATIIGGGSIQIQSK